MGRYIKCLHTLSSTKKKKENKNKKSLAMFVLFISTLGCLVVYLKRREGDSMKNIEPNTP